MKYLLGLAILLGPLAFAPTVQAATYDESGSILLPTPAMLFPGDQVSLLGQGTTAWRLSDSDIANNNGASFTLTSTGATAADFDLYFYSSEGAFVESFTAAGDEAGNIPAGAGRAYLHMFSGAAGEFSFEIA